MYVASAQVMLRLPAALPACVVPALLFASSCSGEVGPAPGSQGPSIDRAAVLAGVADPQADPAVVAVEVEGAGLCAGTLIASDAVLTARRCVDVVVSNASCPASGDQVVRPRSPAGLRVLVGDDIPTAVERARGYEVLEPPGETLCGDDVAVILLDAAIEDRVPLSVRPTAAARGDHLRTVGFDAERKLVRDHVPVADTTAVELSLDEAPCRTAPGGPAIDESTGELVGVLSRSDPSCRADGAHDVYTRLDTAMGLIERALAFGRRSVAAHSAKEKKGPVDLGATCTQGTDCAAGVCVTYASSEYCSRACGPHDKCPAHYKCMQSRQGPTACVE